jgi:hypothetical protein
MYCLSRKSKSEYMNGEIMYFSGKSTDYRGKVDYWEGTGLQCPAGKCLFDNYFEALLMQIECLIIKGRMYQISTYCA